MITLRWTTIALGAALLACAACTERTDVLESTTTTLRQNEDVVASSADGLFAVRARIQGPLEGAKLTIATRRDVQAAGQRGLAYEISVDRAVQLAASAELRIDVPASFDVALSVFARIEADGSVVELGAERSDRSLVVRLAALERLVFTIVTSQCGLSECGVACGPAVSTSTTSCAPAPSPSHVCSESGVCLPSEQVACEIPTELEGWDDAPGTGRAFVVNDVRIAEADVVSDAADPCLATTPRNQLAPLALIDDQLRQSLLGGEGILLLELSGLDQPFSGTDRGLALKSYVARDADDPYFPANNFEVPPGETTCCEFLIDPSAVAGVPPQARSRAVARIAANELRTLNAVPMPLDFGIFEARFDVVTFSGSIDPTLLELELVASAAWSVADLARIESPYCRTLSPMCQVQLGDASMLEFVLLATGDAQPQIDLDFDGLETFHDDDGDGIVDRCIDGCIDACTTPTVVMSTPEVSCATDERFVDGYSITFELTAVPATIVGVGP